MHKSLVLKPDWEGEVNCRLAIEILVDSFSVTVYFFMDRNICFFHSLKFVTNLWKIGGIQGIFYYYGNTLVLTNVLGLVDGSIIFWINENISF